MKVPFFRPSVGEEEIAAVTEVLRSGWLTTGPRARDFEARFAEYIGVRYAVALNSATAALHLAVAALGVRRGDVVLVPTMTFAATSEVVRYLDAIPLLVDVDADSGCLSPAAVARTLEALEVGRAVPGLPRREGPVSVKAIAPVHYAGQVADMEPLLELGRRYGVPLLEDAAHTLPARYRGRMAGTFGKAAAFSFYANKCITTGEGGMLVTDDEELATHARRLSLHGLSHDPWKRFDAGGSWYYEIVEAGFKYNLTDVAAALGIVQLSRANELHRRRAVVAARYQAGLAGVPGIHVPQELPDREHSWHLFAIQLEPGRWRLDRAAVIRALAERGITCSVHWMPLHLHPYYRDGFGYEPGDFPVAQAMWPGLISLPIFPDMEPEAVDYVVESLAALQREHGA